LPMRNTATESLDIDELLLAREIVRRFLL